jgi:hypothetical protein
MRSTARHTLERSHFGLLTMSAHTFQLNQKMGHQVAAILILVAVAAMQPYASAATCNSGDNTVTVCRRCHPAMVTPRQAHRHTDASWFQVSCEWTRSPQMTRRHALSFLLRNQSPMKTHSRLCATSRRKSPCPRGGKCNGRLCLQFPTATVSWGHLHQVI